MRVLQRLLLTLSQGSVIVMARLHDRGTSPPEAACGNQATLEKTGLSEWSLFNGGHWLNVGGISRDRWRLQRQGFNSALAII